MLQQLERPLTALDAIFVRRSVRAYTSDTLDRSTIRALLDAAVQAPTAMLEQTWSFVVVQDRALLRLLSDRVKASLREAGPSRELHLPDLPLRLDAFTRQLANPDFNVFYDAPALIVICAARPGAFVEADCWLAAENLMLAACALGLGTCCIGSAVGVLNTPDGKAALGIPIHVTPVAPIVVGVPAGEPRAAARREPHVIAWK